MEIKGGERESDGQSLIKGNRIKLGGRARQSPFSSSSSFLFIFCFSLSLSSTFSSSPISLLSPLFRVERHTRERGGERREKKEGEKAIIDSDVGTRVCLHGRSLTQKMGGATTCPTYLFPPQFKEICFAFSTKK